MLLLAMDENWVSRGKNSEGVMLRWLKGVERWSVDMSPQVKDK